MRVSLTVAALLALAKAVEERKRAQEETAHVVAQLEMRICELQQRSREITLLAEMSELLHVSGSIAEALQFLPSFGKRLFAKYAGAVYIVDPSQEVAETRASWGVAPDAARFVLSDCRALRVPQPHVLPNDCRHDVDTPWKPRLCVPISVGEQVGVLTLRSTVAEETTSDFEGVARAFADQLSLALTTLQLQEALRTRAVRDALTGLFNRHYMEETVVRDLERYTRLGLPVSVIMLDVDRFKTFNDTFGHAGGDALLQQIARVMQKVVRHQDVICRYGGEEFVVMLPDTPLDAARATAERLLEQVRDLQPHLSGERLDGVTISAGVAASPEHGRTLDALLVTADRALYAAKNTGRDRVVTAGLHAIGRDAA